MADKNTHLTAAPAFRRPFAVPLPSPWSAGAVAIALLVLAPIGSVIWTAFHPTENIWPHLVATTLPRYLSNTLILALATGLLAGAAGTGAAWLVTMYRFPASRLIEWLLLAPLAIPAYVGAYVLVDFLQYSGPVQSELRALFGWHSARDYWFPEIRSRWAAVAVLAAALYPYVYLLARSAFREQAGGSYEMARALGSGPFALFWRVGLPLARPAIAAGVAIVMMETVNDFGVVDFFAVQTLTTGIFSVWLETGNSGGAAQLACLILSIILVLSVLERAGRRKSRFYGAARQRRPIAPQALTGPAGWLACGLCLVPFLAGFVLPVGVMLVHALRSPEAWLSPELARALLNTLTVAGCAAILTVLAAIFMVYGVRLTESRTARFLFPVAAIGYAVPGAVLAVGILIPLAAADHLLADLILDLTGRDPGLIVTGSAAAIILAYTVRFFAIAQGAIDSAFGRIAPSLPLAARSLGRTLGGTLRAVYLPLMRTSLGTAVLLVFVDSVKELPATLLLRPFNFETLATRVQEKASLENITDAAPAALLIIAVGLAAVTLLARAHLGGPGMDGRRKG
ncbi:MAG: iron ABC transporter permease [Proteobacteria bacterium]|nr:iron ABC transporter permease [Pseudomonadota bacterium]